MPTEIQEVEVDAVLEGAGGDDGDDSDSDEESVSSGEGDGGGSGGVADNSDDDSSEEDEGENISFGGKGAGASSNNNNDEDSTVDMEDQTEVTEEIDDEDELTAADTSAAAAMSPDTPHSKKRRKPSSGMKSAGSATGSSIKKSRSPAVIGLTIPFRTVKKAMKLDPGTPIVQNEAAVMATFAAEQFLKTLAKESFRRAKLRGRNTIRYEDIAEARTSDKSLSFLETLFP